MEKVKGEVNVSNEDAHEEVSEDAHVETSPNIGEEELEEAELIHEFEDKIQRVDNKLSDLEKHGFVR